MKKINEVIAATLCWLASYSLIEALRAAADKKVLRAQARREAELKLEVPAEKKPGAPKANEKKKEKSTCAVPSELEVTHYVAEPESPSFRFAVMVAFVVLLSSTAWFGGKRLVGAMGEKYFLPVINSAPPATVVKVLPAAPRPPLPHKGNMGEAVSWWKVRQVDADPAPRMVMADGVSRLADRTWSKGKWVAFAGDSRFTYDYVTARWEQ